MKKWWWGALVLAGCVETVTENDAGVVCFDEVADDGQLTFSWEEPCLSPSVFNVVRNCNATLEGDVILLTSYLEYQEPRILDDACQPATAMCVVRGLEEGRIYTVVFADGEAEVSGGMMMAGADGGAMAMEDGGEICLPR